MITVEEPLKEHEKVWPPTTERSLGYTFNNETTTKH